MSQLGRDDDAHDDSGGDFNFNETLETQEAGGGAGEALPEAASLEPLAAADGTILTGDNLVQQPRKVRCRHPPDLSRYLVRRTRRGRFCKNRDSSVVYVGFRNLCSLIWGLGDEKERCVDQP